MPQGVVTRALSGFFDVSDTERNEQRRCRARGVFRKRKTTVLVGDMVQYDPIGNHEGIITEVLPRKSQLIRPPVANVDQAVIVCSLVSPDFQALFLDRLLVVVEAAGIDPLIVLTKSDLADELLMRGIRDTYEAIGYPVILSSAKSGLGLTEVRLHLQGKISVFTGMSGVGKSTLGNALNPGLGLVMGELSSKIERGKHTTRHVELFGLENHTFIVDAPGFSQLELSVSSNQLRDYFIEFQTYANDCAYRGCQHIDEAECAVVQASVAGDIASSRYASYAAIMTELRHLEEMKY